MSLARESFRGLYSVHYIIWLTLTHCLRQSFILMTLTNYGEILQPKMIHKNIFFLSTYMLGSRQLWSVNRATSNQETFRIVSKQEFSWPWTTECWHNDAHRLSAQSFTLWRGISFGVLPQLCETMSLSHNEQNLSLCMNVLVSYSITGGELKLNIFQLRFVSPKLCLKVCHRLFHRVRPHPSRGHSYKSFLSVICELSL